MNWVQVWQLKIGRKSMYPSLMAPMAATDLVRPFLLNRCKSIYSSLWVIFVALWDLILNVFETINDFSVNFDNFSFFGSKLHSFVIVLVCDGHFVLINLLYFAGERSNAFAFNAFSFFFFPSRPRLFHRIRFGEKNGLSKMLHFWGRFRKIWVFLVQKCLIQSLFHRIRFGEEKKEQTFFFEPWSCPAPLSWSSFWKQDLEISYLFLIKKMDFPKCFNFGVVSKKSGCF